MKRNHLRMLGALLALLALPLGVWAGNAVGGGSFNDPASGSGNGNAFGSDSAGQQLDVSAALTSTPFQNTECAPIPGAPDGQFSDAISAVLSIKDNNDSKSVPVTLQTHVTCASCAEACVSVGGTQMLDLNMTSELLECVVGAVTPTPVAAGSSSSSVVIATCGPFLFQQGLLAAFGFEAPCGEVPGPQTPVVKTKALSPVGFAALDRDSLILGPACVADSDAAYSVFEAVLTVK